MNTNGCGRSSWPISSDPDAAGDGADPFLPFISIAASRWPSRCSTIGAGRDLDALVPIPFQLDRFVALPGPETRFIPLEQVILLFLKYLFPPFELRASGVFRILRDSDLEVEDIDIEEDGHHLMLNIEPR